MDNSEINYTNTFYSEDCYKYNKIVVEAFQKTKDVISTCHADKADNINTSSISTFIIQKVGRFCEHYASDFLIDWARVEECIKELDGLSEEYSVVIGFGIRESGVDHNSFITCRIMENKHLSYKVINDYYRSILAVEVKRTKSEYSWYETYVTLKDIKSAIHYDEELKDTKL